MAQKIVGVGETRCVNCGNIFKKSSTCPACNSTVKESKFNVVKNKSYSSQSSNSYNNEQYSQDDASNYSSSSQSGHAHNSGFSYRFGNFSADVSSKNRLVALLLAIVFGTVGAHRFYTGHYVSGMFFLLATTIFHQWTFLGIWVFFDIIRIGLGMFRDGFGRLIVRWK